ncbi:MAG: hypothetical protein GFH27_549333n101 [Chloroflexi bacterium AL-W]|nr:hypothetical protein [Chloroflexi bacterium AL-N1]NOK70446.1 hypothetical protein [Chloroflexi bacterium AL-N10]NOK78195.1 hypothetical protein [Chloroflexi bacterium AL-N5]NOK85294.1 hypothetical protein [Chloroflexi bacterium AL-W]NOK92059.1 hypothetical protein [Chloroflexi bacterium AL-N15]
MELRVGGALTALGHMSTWLVLMIPLIVGVAVAGSLAVDRRHNYIPLILARGISRWQYFVVKALSMATAAMMAVLISCLLFLCMTALFAPFGNTIQFPGFGRSETGERIPRPPSYPGPLPQLARTAPFWNDVVAIGFLMLAGAALAMVGVVVSTFIANEYLALILPFAAVIGGIYVLRGPLEILQPVVYLELWSTYPRTVPSALLGYAAPLYWGVIGLLLFVVGSMVFLLREPE